MSQYLIYEKDGVFAQDVGALHSSCFEHLSPEEMNAKFFKSSYTMKIISEEEYQNLTLNNIEDLRRKKIAEIERQRVHKQYLPIVYNNYEIYATNKARDNLFKAYILSSNNSQSVINWLDIYDQEITLTLQDAENILSELLKRDSYLYFKEAELKREVRSLTAIEDIVNEDGSIKEKGIKTFKVEL